MHYETKKKISLFISIVSLTIFIIVIILLFNNSGHMKKDCEKELLPLENDNLELQKTRSFDDTIGLICVGMFKETANNEVVTVHKKMIESQTLNMLDKERNVLFVIAALCFVLILVFACLSDHYTLIKPNPRRKKTKC